MINIDEIAIDIGTINNSFYTNEDIPEIKKILLQAMGKDEREFNIRRINLKHSDFESLIANGYHPPTHAYECYKLSKTIPGNHHFQTPTRRKQPDRDYEELILARQEEMWQD